MGGVNSWRDRYDDGENSRPLVDFDEITLHGREVRLCFDSDLDKPQVAAALCELAEFLQAKGAQVMVEVLPNGLDGERLGIRRPDLPSRPLRLPRRCGHRHPHCQQSCPLGLTRPPGGPTDDHATAL